MLVNPGDIADGLLVSAVSAIAGMVTRPHASRRTAAELDVAGWADTQTLIRNGLPGVSLEDAELSHEEVRELIAVLEGNEVQAALQGLLAARLTDAPETEASRAREAVRLTFLEYFAAARLAAQSDTPEDLAAYLVPRLLTDDGWRMAAELSLQIKSRTSDRGADRLYAAALDQIESAPGGPSRPQDPQHERHPQHKQDPQRAQVTEILAGCVDIVDPSPGVVRRLTRVVLDGDRTAFDPSLRLLFRVRGPHKQVIADELEKHVAATAGPGERAGGGPGLELVFGPGRSAPGPPEDGFTWRAWSREQALLHADQLAADYALRNAALHSGAITLAEALQMPGGLSALLETPPSGTPNSRRREPYLARLFGPGSVPATDQDIRDGFRAVGRYLAGHPEPPWVRVGSRPFLGAAVYTRSWPEDLDEVAALGFAALTCIQSELGNLQSGPAHRYPVGIRVPERFRQLFRDWTAGRVDFTEIVPG